MRRPRWSRAALAGVLLLPIIAGGAVLQARDTYEGAQLFDDVRRLVANRFVDTVGDADLYEKAARGLVEELNDPYSELLSPKQMKDFTRNTGGRYGGVGMLIEPTETGTAVSTVFPNTPAERAGVRPGDRILMVDTISARGWKTQQVSDYVTGEPGTKVGITFGRPGVTDPIKVQFTREVIHVPAVPYTLVLDHGIGYIPLQRFNETAAEEVAEGAKKLLRDGARSIILDLRGNPGGILEQSLDISNLFLKEGQEIASVRGRNTAPQVYNARGPALLPATPVVILTDEGSASASEIVAGALQDHDRALVVGETSFGKGLVQSVFNLEGGYALKLTTAKWYTPSGRSIQRERKFENGRFVEVPPDTNETEASKKQRPAFRSDMGRVVYGGGGVTPDILVKDDTLTTVEQKVARALAAKLQETSNVIADYAFELSRSVPASFQVQPAWRAELRRRLEAKGVTLDAADWAAASRYVDRALEQRVARAQSGDSTARRRDIKFDEPLQKAIDVLSRASSQKDLFAIADAEKARHAMARTP